MITRIFIASILLTSIYLPAAQATDEGNSVNERPKIGLALSGGGARGGAHVGVLKALEALNLPVDYIAGTSMGAIIGGLYAAGYNASEIEQILLDTDWKRGFTDSPERKYRTMRKKELESEFLIPFRVGLNNGTIELPLGLISGQQLDQIFEDMLFPVVSVEDFAELPIPFRAIATDLESGEAVVLSEGSFPDALRASMSVPGVFSPVRLDGRLLVDGGISNNLPVNVVREMGADIVIAVDIGSPLLNEDKLTSVVSVSEQMVNFLTRRTTEAQIAQLRPGDILIVPELGDFGVADFKESHSIVAVGEQATLAQKGELEQIALRTGTVEPPAGIASHNEEVPYLIHFIELNNDSVISDRLILSRLALEKGSKLDIGALSRSVNEIYSLDVFELVNYDLVQNEAGETGVRINAIPRKWGPNYLQFGLELSSDFAGNSGLNLGTAYTRNALNPLGGELRVIGAMGREDLLSFDFYQPVDPEARWFIQPVVFYQREDYDYWVEDLNLATFEISGWGAEIGVGRNFSTTGRVKLNYAYANAKAAVLTGPPDILERNDFDIGELSLFYTHDSFDSPWFPTSGMTSRIGYTWASDKLGAAKEYEQAQASGAIATSLGRYTALLNYELGYSFDDAAPIERWYRLGGLSRLSGLARNQLIGRHLAMVNLAAYRRLSNNPLATLYAGFTLEAGNVWEFEDDVGFNDLEYAGSLFLGAETPIGPIYLAYGYHESGDSAVYFYVGNPFRVSKFE